MAYTLSARAHVYFFGKLTRAEDLPTTFSARTRHPSYAMPLPGVKLISAGIILRKTFAGCSTVMELHDGMYRFPGGARALVASGRHEGMLQTLYRSLFEDLAIVLRGSTPHVATFASSACVIHFFYVPFYDGTIHPEGGRRLEWVSMTELSSMLDSNKPLLTPSNYGAVTHLLAAYHAHCSYAAAPAAAGVPPQLSNTDVGVQVPNSLDYDVALSSDDDFAEPSSPSRRDCDFCGRLECSGAVGGECPQRPH